MTEFVNMWKNYVNFKDRTTVRGYWMAFLFQFIIGIVLSLIVFATGAQIISTLWSLAIFLPALAIQIRRLRDAGKKWTNIFWLFLPLIGWVIYIVLLCKPSIEDNGIPQV